ncbi:MULTISPECIES: hypothetical protein [Bacillus]|uniref:hypothetical protein n=1 Tax=Bacillus TaxID=1386 RepID=UPI000BB91E08|nr:MULTISPECIES: hypothetical protein [Bacillus]
MEQTLNLILGELQKLNGKVDNLEGRFDILEKKVDHVDSKVDRLEESLERFEANHEMDVIKILETIERKDKDTTFMIEAFNKRLTRVEKEIVELSKQ